MWVILLNIVSTLALVLLQHPTFDCQASAWLKQEFDVDLGEISRYMRYQASHPTFLGFGFTFWFLAKTSNGTVRASILTFIVFDVIVKWTEQTKALYYAVIVICAAYGSIWTGLTLVRFAFMTLMGLCAYFHNQERARVLR